MGFKEFVVRDRFRNLLLFAEGIETPTTRRVGWSNTILMTPRVSRMAPARGTTLKGMVVHWHIIPVALASSSVNPTTAT